jgi:hypothetical protein
VTSRWLRTAAGSNLTSAAKIARSTQSKRSFGSVLRTTATSWRNRK